MTKIPSATGDSDIKRFLKLVDSHPDTREIVFRMSGYEAEVKARGGTSVLQWSNLRHNGHPLFIKQREALHIEILKKLLTPVSRAHSAKPVAVITVGLPGSGKTSGAVKAAKKKLGIEFASINPDDVKELLDEYEGWNAAALHEESSDLAELRLERDAKVRRHNVIYDITGRDAGKVERAIKGFHSYGYRIFLLLADVPASQAANRVWHRFQENAFNRNRTVDPSKFGRYVPPRLAYEMGDSPRKTFQKLKTNACVEAYCMFNTDVPMGKSAIIIESKGW
jgi:hypothetical protein